MRNNRTNPRRNSYVTRCPYWKVLAVTAAFLSLPPPVKALPNMRVTNSTEVPKIPLSPLHSKVFGGLRLRITGPRHIISGEPMLVNIIVTNHGRRSVRIDRGVPVLQQFPHSWCWGPGKISATHFLRVVAAGNRGGPPAASYGRSVGYLSPGHTTTLWPPLNLSHVFDLSVPGKYKTQLAGKGSVSNLISFRVLPAGDKPIGPAIREIPVRLTKDIPWGDAWHGVQIAAYIKTNRNSDSVARARVLFRCAGKNDATISLVGNPHIDFARRDLAGPIPFGEKAADVKPVPLTAYGKQLGARDRKNPPRSKAYTLKPGILYTYWRRLVLNREFDLSFYGPYPFSTRLHGTQLRTAPLIIYVGVQSWMYNQKSLERSLAHWKKSHGN